MGPAGLVPASPGAAPHTPTTPQLSLGGLKGVNTSELSGGRDGDTSRHNKKCGPVATLATGKSCHTAHIPQSQQGVQNVDDMGTYKYT